NEIPNCAETGVLGVLPGLIGTLQAAEAIKLLSAVGEVLRNKLLLYDLRTSGFFEVELTPNEVTKKLIPETREEFLKKDYSIQCGIAETITWAKALEWVNGIKSSLLIDVRASGELPEVDLPEIIRIPKPDLEQQPERIAGAEHVFLFCKSGVRSQ